MTVVPGSVQLWNARPVNAERQIIRATNLLDILLAVKRLRSAVVQTSQRLGNASDSRYMRTIW